MKRTLLATIGIAVLCGVVAPAGAEARQGRRVVARATSAPPLVVRQRSWLDSGNVVAVGTNNAYLASATTLNEPVYNTYSPARFGQSTLPGRFDLAVPGNPRGPASGGIFFDD